MRKFAQNRPPCAFFSHKERFMVSETESIYQIYLRNFTEEGTFRAAIPNLPRIASMGFSWVYLTPIHPIGKAARKGALGSPYAISNYRAVNPELGSEADFAAFIAAAHALKLKIMIDVVYNHTSPDSVLVRDHPEWFLLGPDGQPWRKCEDWSDVVDFDYQSSPQLWAELIDTLSLWRDRGVDGFRCDVASLVPADFWKQARVRVNQYDPGARRERAPMLWLAESVHPAFLRRMRTRGFGGWAEPELHAAAFDLTYDYDGWERLERIWSGELPIERYLDYLYAQETLYPKGARKLRYLENHDQERAARRFGRGDTLRAWTALYQFLPGVALTYMGQELALDHKPDLFEKDAMRPELGDASFEQYFLAAMRAAHEAKERAPYFSWSKAGDSLLCLRSIEPPRLPGSVDPRLVAEGNYLLAVKLGAEREMEEPARAATPARTHTAAKRHGARNRAVAPFEIEGLDLLTYEPVHILAGDALPDRPAMLVRLGSARAAQMMFAEAREEVPAL